MIMHPQKAMARFDPLRKELTDGQKRDLMHTFGDRVSLDWNERLIYSHDGGALPAPLRIMLKTRAAAVIRARDSSDLYHALRFAKTHLLPVTPRGAGTSWNGASHPAEDGLVVDMRGFNRVLAIDETALTCTVEPGINFLTLEKTLNAKGLSLRTHPTTAPGSTVGGRVALGGGGYGSLEFGSFGDQVVEADMVRPDGKQVTLKGSDLDLVVDAEGTTGFITRLTLRVKRMEAVEPLLITFKDPEKACKAFEALSRLPLWNLHMSTREFSVMRNDAQGTKLLPGDAEAILLAAPKERLAALQSRLDDVVKAFGGEVAKGDLAKREWDNRFNQISVKRMGPSLVTAEVVVPADRLFEALEAARKAAKLEEFGIWCLAVGPREVLLVCQGLADERRPDYVLTHANSVAIVDSVKRFGGRVASAGLLFPGESKRAYGWERMNRWRDFRRKYDPKDLMNPGKIFPAHLSLAPPMDLASFMKMNKPLMMPLRGQFPYKGAAKEDSASLAIWRASGAVNASRGLSKLAHDVTTCSSCGWCSNVCPVGEVDQWESALPRGRVNLASYVLTGTGKVIKRSLPTLHECTACRRCEEVCPSKIPLVSVFEGLRSTFVERGAGSNTAFAAMAGSVKKEHNPIGRPHKDRNTWATGLAFVPTATTLLYAGCTASYSKPNTAKNAAAIAKAAGIQLAHLGADEWCCGDTLLRTGHETEARETILHNVKAVAAKNHGQILSVSPDCHRTISKEWKEAAAAEGLEWEVEAKSIVTAMREWVDSGKIKLTAPFPKKVVWYPGCGHRLAIGPSGSALLKKVPSLELMEAPDFVSCGAGAGMRQGYKDKAQRMATNRLNELKAMGVQTVVTTCGTCILNLEEANTVGKIGLEILDIVDVVAVSAGLMTPPAPPSQPAPAKPQATAPGAGAATPAAPPERPAPPVPAN